jgi:tetratricopeptide (TPR) repeat protein
MRAHLFAVVLLLGINPACVSSGGSAPGRLTPDELLRRADAAFDARRYAQALESYRLAAAAAQAEDASEIFVEGAAQAAHVHLLKGQAAEGEVWLENALAQSQEHEVRGRARILLTQAAYQHHAGDTSQALDTCTKAHALSRASGQHVRAVQVAHMAAVMSGGEDQLRWCRRAIDDATRTDDALLLGALWRQLGWLLEERGLHDQALESFIQCREVVSESGNSHEQMVADWQVGHGLRLVGRITEARIMMEEIARRTRAQYRTRRGTNQAEWLGQALRELGELDLAQGNPERGIQHLRDAREYFVLAGASDLAPDLLAQVDRRLAQARNLQRAVR